MLCLTREVDQTIVIADGLITVKVLGFDGRRVRLGIDAPRDIEVHRGELFARLRWKLPPGQTPDDPDPFEAAAPPAGG